MRRVQPMRNKYNGFTLIELLLTITIMSVLVGTVSLSFHISLESWKEAKELADRNLHGDAIMEQVVQALRSAYYPQSTEPSYEYGFTFEDDGGESPNANDKISWVKIGNSLVGENVAWAGTAHRVELYVDDSSGEEGIYVKAWQLVGLDDEFDPEEDVEPILLSKDVVSLNCRMIDPEITLDPLDEIEWLDEWSQSNRIPTKVEITIAVQQKGSKEEPTEYVRTIDIPMANLSWDLSGPKNSSKKERVPGNRNKDHSDYIGGDRSPSAGESGAGGGGSKGSSGGAPSGGGGPAK